MIVSLLCWTTEILPNILIIEQKCYLKYTSIKTCPDYKNLYIFVCAFCRIFLKKQEKDWYGWFLI